MDSHQLTLLLAAGAVVGLVVVGLRLAVGFGRRTPFGARPDLAGPALRPAHRPAGAAAEPTVGVDPALAERATVLRLPGVSGVRTPDAGLQRITSPSYQVQARRWARVVEAGGWWRDPDLTLGALAGRLATSPRTLSRVLKEGRGQSFRAFLNGLRVAEVVARLRAGDESDLLALAFDAGFASKASFNRAFRSATGLTPSAFRDQVRAAQEVAARDPRVASSAIGAH